jgi:hypothetical protein
MKRLVVALSLAMLVSLALGAAAYAASGSDSARGTVDQGTQEWRFSATSNFNGTQPSGQVRLIQENQDPNLVITGDVTCLQVLNGSASIVAEITDVRGGFTNADSLIIQTTDNGKFSTTPDTFAGVQSFTPATELCPPPTLFQQPVLKGEVVVVDATS